MLNDDRTNQLTGDAAPGAVISDRRRQVVVLAAVCLALVAVIASMAALNVAQQAIAVDLGASQSDLLWVVNAYTLVLAGLLMPLGAIGDRWGRKPVLLAGLVLFVAAGIAGSQAGSIEFLIATRVVAGIAGAMIMPATLSVITSSFPIESRGTAVGVWTGFAGAGGILGLLGASAIVDNATWRWVFAVAVVPAALSLVVSVFVVPNSGEDSEHAFDTPGAVLSFVAIAGLVLGIQEGPERGWTAALTLVGLIAGLLALAGYLWWELRHPAPLFDIRMFRAPRLAAGSFGLLVMFSVLFGLFLVLIQFLVAVVGYTALEASASLVPLALVMLTLSPLAPAIAHRFGLTATLSGGLLIAAAGIAVMALRADAQTYTALLPGIVLLAIGVGLAMTPATTAITASLPVEDQGVASALNDTVREVGGAIGVAILGSMLNAGYSDEIAPTVAGLPPELGHAVDEGIAGAGAAASQLPPDQAAPIMAAARDAFTNGWIDAMWVGAAMLVVAAIASAAILRRPAANDHVTFVTPATSTQPNS